MMVKDWDQQLAMQVVPLRRSETHLQPSAFVL